MSITYGDYLRDIGHFDITPEQEREFEAREECARRGIDPDEICADGGITAWMVVDREMRPQDARDGREIAMSVDPNTSDDVCTFCRHSKFGEVLDAPTCTLGHTPYFRSLSNLGPIWVSDCKAGELLPEFSLASVPDRSDPCTSLSAGTVTRMVRPRTLVQRQFKRGTPVFTAMTATATPNPGRDGFAERGERDAQANLHSEAQRAD